MNDAAIGPTPPPSALSALASFGSFLALALTMGSGCIIDSPEPLACGVNATEGYHECVCDSGYAGDPYEACDPVQTYLVTDDCDDKRDIEWRLFSQDEDWQWPDADNVYVTPGFLHDHWIDIACYEGEYICFGAQAGGLHWGVGIDGELACDDCCFECGPYTVDVGYLSC